MEFDIERAKKLIADRDEIDSELASLFTNGKAATRKPQSCSRCGAEGHSARTCPQKEAPQSGV